jgi:hypothetical protein
MRVTLLLSMFFIVASGQSKLGQSLWEPPLGDAMEPLPKASVSREFIKGLRVANLDIVLDDTMMKEVQARLGGALGNRGDAGTHLDWVCFQGADPSGRWALWLESNEVNGGAVGGIEFRRIRATAVLDNRCRVLPKADSRVALPVSIQLGIKETQVVKVLGEPTVRDGNKLVYFHEHEETIRGEIFSAMNILTVLIRGGVVEAIQVWKTVVS